MENLSIFTLQEKLRKRKTVSVPQLQMDFDMDYKKARAFLQDLQRLGWIAAEPQGNQYSVNPEHLQMRKLQRFEVDRLIEDINSDCIAMLLQIIKKRDSGLASDHARDVLDTETASEETLQLLTRHRLIYFADNAYYLRVSRKTVHVLESVVRAKRQTEMSRRMTGRDGKDNDLRKLFDCLFDE